MANSVGLHQLVGAVAGAIVDAQGLVEQHYIDQIRRYFGDDGRPKCLHIKIPRASRTTEDYLDVAVPLLSLTEAQVLAIRDLKVDLEVELGEILDAPMPLPQLDPGSATAAGANASRAAAPSDRGGAPIGTPLADDDPAAARLSGGQASASAGQSHLQADPAAQANPPPLPLPAKMLTLSVGSRGDAAPRARLSINVAARPPSEGMLRLLTQLNKLV